MELIEFTRGDTVYKKFQRKRRVIDSETGKTNLIPIIGKADNVVFSVKENIYSNKVLIEKSLEDGTIAYDEKTNYHYFKINPEDTQDFSFDKEYYYDIEITVNEDVRTICKGILRVTWDVTTPKNKKRCENG